MQQPIGEDVTALVVGRELHFVHGYEIHLARERHGLGGAHPIVRTARHPLFFPRDQRDAVLTDAQADAVVHLARQQPQRQPQHAAFVLQHALHGAVRLAGIGRAEQRDALGGIR